MHYTRPTAAKILDGTAGLWCVNAGHCQPPSSRRSAPGGELDYAPPFQMGHPIGVRVRQRLASSRRAGLNHVFFTNSGSEAVDTALKIALAYHRARGEGSAPASSAASAAITAWASAACRSAASSTTARCSARCCRRRPPAATPTTSRQRLHARPAEHGARARRRTRAHRRAARRLDHRRRHRRAGGRLDRRAARRWAICSACARSATGTASC
jgi:4-aminobutyrate aminotransferase-like enzyme